MKKTRVILRGRNQKENHNLYEVLVSNNFSFEWNPLYGRYELTGCENDKDEIEELYENVCNLLESIGLDRIKVEIVDIY